MRPTFLQFRSPKEKTGEFLYPAMTNTGKSMQIKPKEYTKSTFPKGERWEHIRQLSCRTSIQVGPGCYKTPLSTNKGRSAVICKDLAQTATGQESDFIYVGDSILRRERPMSRAGTMTPRSTYGYFTDKNSSPMSSRYAGEVTFTDLMQKTRAVSAGKARSFGDLSRESFSPSLRKTSPRVLTRSPSCSPKKKASTLSELRLGDSPLSKRRTSPIGDFPTATGFSYRLSPTKLRGVGNLSPSKSSVRSSKSTKHSESSPMKRENKLPFFKFDEEINDAHRIVVRKSLPAGSRKNIEAIHL